MTYQEVLTLVGAAAVTLGPVGTALEAIGSSFKWPKVVAIGQRIEAVAIDLPKLIKGDAKPAVSAEVKS